LKVKVKSSTKANFPRITKTSASSSKSNYSIKLSYYI
jgi:hypothetical protein